MHCFICCHLGSREMCVCSVSLHLIYLPRYNIIYGHASGFFLSLCVKPEASGSFKQIFSVLRKDALNFCLSNKIFQILICLFAHSTAVVIKDCMSSCVHLLLQGTAGKREQSRWCFVYESKHCKTLF